jgi:arginase family enzyme
MQLPEYLSPVNEEIILSVKDTSPQSLVNVLDIHTQKMPAIDETHIAIIGVKDSRLSDNDNGCAYTPDEVRKYFYSLVKPKYPVKIADLGNIEAGDSFNDTLFALNSVLNELIKQKVTVVILGGTQDLIYAQFTAYQGTNPNLNAVAIDSRVDLRLNEKAPAHSNYLYKMISHQPNYLFNIVHMGNQNYFVEQESLDAFEKMNFDLIRLGNLRHKIQESEPLFRNANMVSFSMNAVRASDSPASTEANPNGLFGEEACQLVRYAGMGNDVSSIGFYDRNSLSDVDGRSAKLCAQMMWYFIDGYYSRTNDYPVADSNDYMLYRTNIQNGHYEVVFYKNIYTDRWWMEVPYPKERSKSKGMFLVPCSYSDYQAALNDELPDRWLKAYNKLG